MFVVLGRGCDDFGSTEGDRCNALIATDECNSGLRCTAVSCAATYCCPENGSSTNPNCQNIVGCPDTDDGGDEASADDAGADSADAAPE